MLLLGGQRPTIARLFARLHSGTPRSKEDFVDLATSLTSHSRSARPNNNFQCRQVSSTSNKGDTSRCSNSPLYLHVGPSGDVWTGESIFAAKHLQPDYVKSVSLEGEPAAMMENDGSLLTEILESRLDWALEIYDRECLPDALREYILQMTTTDKGEGH